MGFHSSLLESCVDAGVYCIIVGFANFDTDNKLIFEYEDITGEPHIVRAKNINPYLVDSKNLLLEKPTTSVCGAPKINYGSFALDNGNYTLSEVDGEDIISECHNSERLIKPFIGGKELLHAIKRYCLWLIDTTPKEIKENSKILDRVEAVRKWRRNRGRENTNKLADTPTVFAEIRQPNTNYLAVPTTTSENRKYIPIAFLHPNIIASNQLYIVPNTTLYHFGVLTSAMHMTWTKYVCGRYKGDFRYSARIVYNNFPWPESPSPKQIEHIEQCAKAVLEARKMFPYASLADLYDPLTMPPVLMKAHHALDKTVDTAYRTAPFTSDSQRMEFLFDLYSKYNAALLDSKKKKK